MGQLQLPKRSTLQHSEITSFSFPLEAIPALWLSESGSNLSSQWRWPLDQRGRPFPAWPSFALTGSQSTSCLLDTVSFSPLIQQELIPDYI